MNNIQEIIKSLAPITLLITAITGLLDVLIKLFYILEKYLPKLRPGFRILFLVLTQLIPVGCVIWNFIYFAAIYSERLTEKVFFLLIIIYPTLLISLYEYFWGVRFYPKLLSDLQVSEPKTSTLKSNRARNNNKGSKP